MLRFNVQLAFLLALLLAPIAVNAQYGQSVATLRLNLSGPVSFDTLPVQLETNDYSYSDYGTVYSGSLDLFNVPLNTAITVRLLPSQIWDTSSATWDYSRYCDTSIVLNLTDLYTQCSYYDPGTSPGLDDSCEYDITSFTEESPSNILQFQLQASGQAVADTDVYLEKVTNDPNDYYHFSAKSDFNGQVEVASCGNFVAGDKIKLDIYPYSPGLLGVSKQYTVANPPSATLSTLVLPSGTTTNLTVRLIDRDGKPWPVPSGTHPNAEVYCYESYDQNNSTIGSYPGSAFLSTSDTQATVQLLSIGTSTWECSFTYWDYTPGDPNDPNDYGIDTYITSSTSRVTITAGQATSVNVSVANPVDLQVTLVDDQGQPVSDEVYVQANPSQDETGYSQGGWGGVTMGAGVNSATMTQLTDGATYEIVAFPQTYFGALKNPQPFYYLYPDTAGKKIKVGTYPTETLSTTVVIKRTSAAIALSMVGPDGTPVMYNSAIAICYDSTSESSNASAAEVYEVHLDDTGTGLLPVPEGKDCDVEVKSSYDSLGSPLIPTTGRLTFKNIAANQVSTANFTFAKPDYFLDVALRLADGTNPFSEYDYQRCTLSSIDGKTAEGYNEIATDPSNPNPVSGVVSLGLLTAGDTKGGTWLGYCEGDSYGTFESKYYFGLFTYNVKAGTNTDVVTVTVEEQDYFPFEKEFEFGNQQQATLAFQLGELIVPGQTFGESGKTYVTFSTTNEEAKKAKSTQIPVVPAVNIRFTDEEGGKGNELQPSKGITLRFLLDESKLAKLGGELDQVQMLRFNPDTKQNEIQPAQIVEIEGKKYLEGTAKRSSTWGAILNKAKETAAESGRISSLRSTLLTKDRGEKFAKYKLQCESEREGIFAFQIVEEEHQKAKSKKSKDKDRGKKKKKKKKKKKGKDEEGATDEETDPFEGVDTYTSDSCEVDVTLKRDATYRWQAWVDNQDAIEASELIKVKPRKKPKGTKKGKAK